CIDCLSVIATPATLYTSACRTPHPPRFTLSPYTPLFRAPEAGLLARFDRGAESQARPGRGRGDHVDRSRGEAGDDAIGGLSTGRSEEHTSEPQSRRALVCLLLL